MTVLNKYIASSGFCSRRKAVEHIKAKEVYVNNEIIDEPFYKVSGSDLVQVKDKIIKPQKFQYFLFNKSKNVICTLLDPGQRKTIADVFNNVSERVYPIGRLDRNTTGLIVVTNDGNLNQQLAHPKYEVKKIYTVTLDKSIAPFHFNILLKGLNLFDGFMKVDGIYYSNEKHKRSVSVVIHSGKNHIVKRLFQEIGFKVMRLDRVYYGGLTKKNLPLGTYRKLTAEEIDFLKSDQRASKNSDTAIEHAPVSASPLKRRKPAAAAPDNRRGEPVSNRQRDAISEKRFINNVTDDMRTSRTTRTQRALSVGRPEAATRRRATAPLFENRRSEFGDRARPSMGSSDNRRSSASSDRRTTTSTRSESTASKRTTAPLFENRRSEFGDRTRPSMGSSDNRRSSASSDRRTTTSTRSESTTSKRITAPLFEDRSSEYGSRTKTTTSHGKAKSKSFTGKRPSAPQKRSRKAESALNRLRKNLKKKRS